MYQHVPREGARALRSFHQGTQARPTALSGELTHDLAANQMLSDSFNTLGILLAVKDR